MSPRGNPYLKKVFHADGRLYGKYKEKPNTQITQDDLVRALAGQKLSDGHQPRFVKPLRDKSFTAMVFQVGPRKMEPVAIMKEDMMLTPTHLIFKIPAFKHGERAGPLELPLDRPGVDLIVQQWQKTRKGKRVWRLSPSTAYRVIVRALGKCPHWLRHNWITTTQQVLNGTPAEVDRKIMAWTGQKRRETLDPYRLKMQADIHDISAAGLKKPEDPKP